LQINLFAVAVIGATTALVSTAHADVTIGWNGFVDVRHPNATPIPLTTYYVSGQKLRRDTPLFTSIDDFDTDVCYMISREKKMYVRIPLNRGIRVKRPAQPSSEAGNAVPKDRNKTTIKVADTGRTTVFDGYRCRHYICTSTYTAMIVQRDVLATEDLGVDERIAQEIRSTMQVDGDVAGIPLQVATTSWTYGKKDGPTSTETVTSISTNPIPAGYFQVADGYKDMSAPNVLR
jgi:hypothetical protein